MRGKGILMNITRGFKMKFKEIPMDEAATYKGKNMVAVYENYYWIATKENMLLVHARGTPQCNRIKRNAECLLKTHPGCRLVQIPVVFLEID